VRMALSERLRDIEASSDVGLKSCGCSIRVANDLDSRQRAYELIYRLYLEKEYAKPNPSRLWVSMFDALPETVTLLAERGLPVQSPRSRVPAEPGTGGVPVGALTVVFDSPLGLPADGIYGQELDALRDSGRSLAEIISLGIDDRSRSGAGVLVELFNAAYFVARGVRTATDFVITVNPRHTRFYRRLMLFEDAGPDRNCDRVGGAPAVLLRLNLDRAERHRETEAKAEHEAVKTGSIYSQFRTVREAAGSVESLRRQLCPMSDAELQHFVAAQPGMFDGASPEQRRCLATLRRRVGLVAAASGGPEPAVVCSAVARPAAAQVQEPPRFPYSYDEATSRNLGLLTAEEQSVLRDSTVAIAGMGAVGGHYLLTLARMGVGGFVICDPDHFEAANLQRQAGAFSHTLGRSKAAVMAEMALAVNPELRIRVIPEALSEANAADFLFGADLVLDGIDFFQIDARRTLFRAAREAGIHAITSGPIGYGASLQIFDPKGMSFDEFFGIRPGMTRAERMALFGAGLLPRIPRSGAMDASRVDFETEKGPALASSIMLCAGIMSCEVMRILLKRGSPRCVPQAFYFDPYNREYVRGRRSRLFSRLFSWLVRRVALRRFPSLLRLHQAELAAAD